MDTVITVIQVLLGLPLSVGGLLKLTLPYAKYATICFSLGRHCSLPTAGWLGLQFRLPERCVICNHL
jgi:hypothetical protein